MKSAPRLRITILYMTMAWVCLVVTLSPGIPIWTGLLAGGVGVIFFSAGILSLSNWIFYAYSMRVRDIDQGRVSGDVSLTLARTTFLREYRALTDDQLHALGRYQAVVGIIPGEPDGPIYQLQLPGGNVEWEFLEVFLAESKGNNLAEVRQWSENSWRRKSAEVLTAYFITSGFAVPAKGNQSAAWLDKPRAMKALRIRED